MQILGMIIFQRFTDRQPVSLGDIGEMLSDRFQGLQVYDRRVAERAKILRYVENRRLGRAVGERRHGRMENLHAEFDALEIAKRGLPAVAVRVKFDGYIAGALQNYRNERASAL